MSRSQSSSALSTSTRAVLSKALSHETQRFAALSLPEMTVTLQLYLEVLDTRASVMRVCQG
jgi:hypothetical protein